MLNTFLHFDTNLFLLINHLPHNFFSDYFFGALSFIGEYGAIWFLLTFLLFIKNQLRRATPFEASFQIEAKKFATIYITGVFSLLLVFVLKKIFSRERPEFLLQNVILPFGPDNSFSFPSGHALTSFVFAALLMGLGKLGRLGKLGVLMLAILISFSRLYLGYHYPLDLVAGAVIGIGIAKISLKVLAIQK